MSARRVSLNVLLIGLSCCATLEALHDSPRDWKCERCPMFFGLGNQKSGSTVVGAVVAAAFGIEYQNDIKRAWQPSTFFRSLTDRQLCRMMPGKHHVVAKEGHLTLFKNQIHSICPDTKFYFNVRHPVSNIISIMDRLNMAPADLMKHPSSFWRLTPGWRDVVDMKYAGVDEETVLAVLTARWNLMADLYLKAPQGIALVKFEHIMSDSSCEETIKEVVRSLGGMNPNMKEALAKLGFQYQSLGKHHSPLNSTAWKTFLGSDIFDFIVSKTEKNMLQLGYGEASSLLRVNERSRMRVPVSERLAVDNVSDIM